MAGGEASTTERRGQARKLIERMLDERRRLLSLLLEVSSRKPNPPDQDLLDEFSQMLMDYIAAGHFGLYQRIIEGKERRRMVQDIAVKVYSMIEETTRVALEFNEKYTPEKTPSPGSFYTDLSSLGESLTTRIEHEDQLIRTIMSGSGSPGG
ncbi:MAG TPA: Rsd/AlgQ family anti-sigma factor [Gammaproteobacteria bacterium]|nr:Rsd/AlgQ family anti-sigma factor [Gammaproteobacteria bacterium]